MTAKTKDYAIVGFLLVRHKLMKLSSNNGLDGEEFSTIEDFFYKILSTNKTIFTFTTLDVVKFDWK